MKRLLYIEDDYNNFLLVEHVLRVFSTVVVSHAPAARDGLEKARIEPPDLILVDIHLPGMDGFEFMRELKNEPVLACIPVIVLTANVMQDDRERAVQFGCAEFITKPFNLNRFRQLVARYLGLDFLR